MKPFDPKHPRCIFPRFGLQVDAALRAKGLTPEDVARHMGIDGSSVRGWRRGFGRVAPQRKAALEAILGITLDMTEPTPTAAKAAAGSAGNNGAPATDPVLPHLAAIALAHGYEATFTPIA